MQNYYGNERQVDWNEKLRKFVKHSRVELFIYEGNNSPGLLRHDLIEIFPWVSFGEHETWIWS